MDWIYGRPVGERHRIVQGMVNSGSGQWLVESDTFQAWRKGLTSPVILGLGIGESTQDSECMPF